MDTLRTLPLLRAQSSRNTEHACCTECEIPSCKIYHGFYCLRSARPSPATGSLHCTCWEGRENEQNAGEQGMMKYSRACLMVDDSNIAFLNGCVYRQNIYITSHSTHITNNRRKQSLPDDPNSPAASQTSNYSYGTNFHRIY
jgi:hypothetical protein